MILKIYSEGSSLLAHLCLFDILKLHHQVMFLLEIVHVADSQYLQEAVLDVGMRVFDPVKVPHSVWGGGEGAGWFFRNSR